MLTRYPPSSVANAFVRKSFVDRNLISPMKIQKLVYLAHGYCLHYEERPMLDRPFMAWKFGPVLPTLYHECKRFTRKGINELVTGMDTERWTLVETPSPDDNRAMEIISFVWGQYGKVRATVLSCWTHEKNGPWARITENGTQVGLKKKIPDNQIKEYFDKKFREC